MALVTAALLYVAIVVLVVPSELGEPLKSPRESFSRYGVSERTEMQFGSALTTNAHESLGETNPAPTAREPMRAPVTQPANMNVRRGFSPPLERPEAPEPPPPPEPPAAPQPSLAMPPPTAEPPPLPEPPQPPPPPEQSPDVNAASSAIPSASNVVPPPPVPEEQQNSQPEQELE